MADDQTANLAGLITRQGLTYLMLLQLPGKQPNPGAHFYVAAETAG